MEDRPVFMLLLRLTGNEGLDEEAGSGLSLKVSRNTLQAQSINVIRSRPFLICEMLRPFICTRIMISKGMVSKGQSTQIGPGKGFQYSF